MRNNKNICNIYVIPTIILTKSNGLRYFIFIGYENLLKRRILL